MAITYDRKEKCGEATFEQKIDGVKTYTVDLYTGNCFLIMVFNDGNEDRLHSFFVDETHMERCLKDNIFTGVDTLISITINKAKCRNYKKIVALLAEYLDDINITVCREGEQTWKEYKTPEQIIPDIRMRELAETAISYLNDEDMINDFLEDRGIELSEEEKSYFCIYEEDDEYDD